MAYTEQTTGAGTGSRTPERPAVWPADGNPEEAVLEKGTISLRVFVPRDGRQDEVLADLKFGGGDHLPEGFSVWTPAGPEGGEPGRPLLQVDVPRALRGATGLYDDAKPSVDLSFTTPGDCDLEVLGAGVGAHAYEDGKGGKISIRLDADGRGDAILSQGGYDSQVLRDGSGPGGAYGNDCVRVLAARNDAGDGPAEVNCPGQANRLGTGRGDAKADHPDATAFHASPGGGRTWSHEELQAERGGHDWERTAAEVVPPVRGAAAPVGGSAPARDRDSQQVSR